MNKRIIASIAFAVIAWMTGSLFSQSVIVTVSGEVEFNQVNSGFLGDVNVGDAAIMTFMLDASDFQNSANFPTRGYVINHDSFSLSFAGNAIGLQNPFPAGQTPYFVLRDNDPAVDGFYLSTDPDFPAGVPIAQAGNFDQFRDNFSVTYSGDTLSSLDILDALGTYDFTGLSVFNWTIDDGPFQPVGILFSELTIESTAIPEPASATILMGIFLMPLVRRTRIIG